MIIGIVTRESKSEENHKIRVIYEEMYNAIRANGGIPLGITLDRDYKEVLNIFDGIIFQGGDDIEEYDLEALEYLYDIDKPVLGICLGMQEMGILFNGSLISTNNHKKKLSYAHSVKVKRNSLLYNILKNDIIKVNSRHNDRIINTKLDVSGISNDGIVEAIEDKNKKFFLGMQWHPESMISYDKIQNNVFKYFINKCKE